MNSKYTSGVRREREIVNWLKENGYEATRSAGSKGAVDVIGYNDSVVRFIQCKYESNPKKRNSYKKDLERLNALFVPACSTVELWVYIKGLGLSEVLFVKGDPSSVTTP